MPAEKLHVEELFQRAIKAGCSDIHVKPGSPPKIRSNGKLVVIPGYESIILDGEQTEVLTRQTMDERAFSRYQTEGVNQWDYSYELPGSGRRFRVNAYKTRGNDAFVARLLANKAKSLDELGVISAVKNLATSKSGLVIVTGATGSGKSTTMSGMVDYINHNQPVNIVSIEDPIEIIHNDAMASISQREVGMDVDSYDAALVAALRQDPDVILIGEIRHANTLKTALQAADTGHLVVATLHTTDTVKAINRIVALVAPGERELIRQQLAATLKGIVGQRLIPTIDGTRTVVNEILLNIPQVSEMILEETSEHIIREVLENNDTMSTFEQSFVTLVENGKVSLEVAKEYSNYPEYYDTVTIKKPYAASELPKPNKPAPHFPGIPPAKTQIGAGLPTAPPVAPTSHQALPSLPGADNPKPATVRKNRNPHNLLE